MDIERLGPGDEHTVEQMGPLFDGPAAAEATQRFLHDERHHLLVAREDGEPAGFVSGVEMTHPDKGTEMFLYELGVEEPWRRRGIGSALVAALGEVARERGCYGMWSATETDNVAARATYAAAGGTEVPDQVMLEWDLS